MFLCETLTHLGKGPHLCCYVDWTHMQFSMFCVKHHCGKLMLELSIQLA